LDKSLGRQTANALTWKFLDLVGVKAIFLIRLLVLARLLSPEDFGLLAIGLTTITLLMTLSDFGIVPALIQKPDVSEQDYHCGWTMGLSRALLVTLVLLLCAPWIAGFFGDVRAAPIIQVLALGVVLDALASIKIAGLNRELNFRSLTAMHLANAIASTGVAVALAPVYGVWALVAGSLAGSFTTAVFSYIIAPYQPRLSWTRSAVSGLLDFGRWIFLTGLIVMIANAGLRAVISRELGVAELGIFFLSLRLAFLPYEAIVGIVDAVAFPLYARLQGNPGQAREVFNATLLGMATLLIPASLLLVAITPGLIEHILGENWSGTATAIRILAISGIIGLAGDAIVPLLKGFGKPSRVTSLEILQSGLSLALVWLLVGHFGLLGAVLAMLLAVTVTQPLCIVYTRTLLERPYAGLWRPLAAVSIASLASAALAAWLDDSIPGIGGFALAATTGTAVASGSLLAADRYLGLGIAYTLGRHFPLVSRFLRIETRP